MPASTRTRGGGRGKGKGKGRSRGTGGGRSSGLASVRGRSNATQSIYDKETLTEMQDGFKRRIAQLQAYLIEKGKAAEGDSISRLKRPKFRLGRLNFR